MSQELYVLDKIIAYHPICQVSGEFIKLKVKIISRLSRLIQLSKDFYNLYI